MFNFVYLSCAHHLENHPDRIQIECALSVVDVVMSLALVIIGFLAVKNVLPSHVHLLEVCLPLGFINGLIHVLIINYQKKEPVRDVHIYYMNNMPRRNGRV